MPYVPRMITGNAVLIGAALYSAPLRQTFVVVNNSVVVDNQGCPNLRCHFPVLRFDS